MRSVLDILIFFGVILALLFTFGAGGDLSWRHPTTWIMSAASTYLYWRIVKLIYDAKPRWQREREAQQKSQSGSSK